MIKPLERCKEQVHNEGRSVGFHRCTRKAVRDGFCNQHHPDTVAERQEAAMARYREAREKDPAVRLEKLTQLLNECPLVLHPPNPNDESGECICGQCDWLRRVNAVLNKP